LRTEDIVSLEADAVSKLGVQGLLALDTDLSRALDDEVEFRELVRECDARAALRTSNL
jgi:hypothetical protein